MADNKLSAQVTIDTKQAVTSLAGLNKSVKGSAEVLQKLKPAAASGGAALTSLSRIAQDAPFGFIAIQNNVTEAVAAFGHLKQSTGSTGGALRALASSLAGPGGVLLAFSAITSGVTFLIQKYGSLGNAMDVLLGHTKALTDEQKKYAEEQHKTAVSIQTQRIETEQLVKVARGDIGSKGEQIAALEQLNKAIPDYIGVLTESNLKTAEGAKIIDTYTRALEKQATAELLVGRAAELNVRKIDARNKFTETQTALLKRQADIEAEIAQSRAKGGKLIGSGADLQAGTLDALGGRLIDLKTKYKDNAQSFIESIGDINKELEKLRKDIDENTVVLDTSGDAKAGGAAKKIKEAIEKGLEADSKIRFTPEIVTLPSGIQVQDGVKKLNTFVQQSINTELATKQFQAPVNVIIKPAFDDKEFKKLLKQLNDILTSGITDAFTSIGEGLGDALTSGTNAIKSLAKGFLGAFGGLISSIGEALIKYGIVKTGLDKVITAGIALPGAAAIAIGVAAVALGQLVKNAIPKFAQGGIVTGPTVGMIGEAGQPEVILPLSKINQFLSGEGQGNGGALTLSVSGDVFTFGLARNARKQSRLY